MAPEASHNGSQRRPVRIAGASGSASDRRHAITSLASSHPSDPIDVIIGDWLSEFNMVLKGSIRSAAPATTAGDIPAYEPSFLEAITPALSDISKHGIKVVVNAGASDTERLAADLKDVIRQQGLNLKVAWISGDEVLPAVLADLKSGASEFGSIYTNRRLSEWDFEPIYAQAYLGGLGIAAALHTGAEIVVCGRVSDASPVIGAAVWWHSWEREELGEEGPWLDRLANALVAGHLIECSTYVTSGNFTGFKKVLADGQAWDDLGFPIAEIAASGQVIIAKQLASGGEVSVDTCTSQLLYEIQGPVYLNSDVAAVLDGIWFEPVGKDRVALYGVKSGPPPPTTKVGITARGGYQAEVHWFLVGLDIQEKARMIEGQIRKLLSPHAKKFSRLHFSLNGTAAEDPEDQESATVNLRVFVQARNEEDLAPHKFIRPCTDVVMQAYPGATPHLDIRQGFPKEFFEYYVTLIPQSKVVHKAHLHDGRIVDISPPGLNTTKVWPKQQFSQEETERPVDMQRFGKTVRGPLGWIVHARSGDKGSDANVGFWVRREDEWEWLRTLLSVKTAKGLLGKEYSGDTIDRFELPGLRAVHFLLHDHLDRGTTATSKLDFLGKNVAEFLRARFVDIPVRFLERGKL